MTMNETEIRVLKSIYALSDDIDYNLYEAVDIAEYANLDKNVVDKTIASLYQARVTLPGRVSWRMYEY